MQANIQNKEQIRMELKKQHKNNLVKNFGTEHEQLISEILDIYEAEIRSIDNDGFKFFFELTRQKIHQNRKNILPKYLDKRSKNIELVKGIMNSEGIVKSDKIEEDTKKVWKRNLQKEKKIQKNQFTQDMKDLKQNLQRDQRQKSVQRQQNKLSQTQKKRVLKSSTPNLKIDQRSLEQSNNFYLQKLEKLVKNLDNELKTDLNDKLTKQINQKKDEIRKSLINIQKKLDLKNIREEKRNKNVKKSQLHLNVSKKKNTKINELKNKKKNTNNKFQDTKSYAIKVFKKPEEIKVQKQVQIKELEKQSKSKSKTKSLKQNNTNISQKKQDNLKDKDQNIQTKQIKVTPPKKSINSLESFRKHLSQDSHSIQNLLDRFNKQSLFSNMQHISKIESKNPSLIVNKQNQVDAIDQNKSVIENLNKIQKLVAIYEKRIQLNFSKNNNPK